MKGMFTGGLYNDRKDASIEKKEEKELSLPDYDPTNPKVFFDL